MFSNFKKIIPHILFGATFFLAVNLKTEAKEVTVNNKASICPAERIGEENDLKSSKKKKVIQKTQLSNEDKESSAQDEKLCQKSKKSEAFDETIEVPEDSEASADEDFDGPSNPTDSSKSDSVIPDELNTPQPSISNQDSHNLNINLQFGGVSSGSDESILTPEYPSGPEVFSPEPPAVPQSPADNFEQSTLLLPSSSKPQRKQRYKSKSHKQEHHKTKKLNRRHQRLNRKYQKRSHQKSFKQRSHRDRKIQRHQVQIHQIKGHRTKFYPVRQQNIRKHTKRTHLRQGGFYRTRPTQLPNALRLRTPSYPRFRQRIAPQRNFRLSAPRSHRVPRRH